MKISDMSTSEYEGFYNLGKLQQWFRYKKLDKLNLKYLDLLRDEIDTRLQVYNTTPVELKTYCNVLHNVGGNDGS